MALVLRPIGIARARVKIGLATLADNMKRRVGLNGKARQHGDRPAGRRPRNGRGAFARTTHLGTLPLPRQQPLATPEIETPEAWEVSSPAPVSRRAPPCDGSSGRR